MGINVNSSSVRRVEGRRVTASVSKTMVLEFSIMQQVVQRYFIFFGNDIRVNMIWVVGVEAHEWLPCGYATEQKASVLPYTLD